MDHSSSNNQSLHLSLDREVNKAVNRVASKEVGDHNKVSIHKLIPKQDLHQNHHSKEVSKVANRVVNRVEVDRSKELIHKPNQDRVVHRAPQSRDREISRAANKVVNKEVDAHSKVPTHKLNQDNRLHRNHHSKEVSRVASKEDNKVETGRSKELIHKLKRDRLKVDHKVKADNKGGNKADVHKVGSIGLAKQLYPMSKQQQMN